MRRHHEDLAAPPPVVGAHRNLGLFGILDLVRSREPWTPLTPFNGTSDEMKAIGKYFREHGLYTLVANNSIHTNPPLCITEEQLGEGFAIIDGRSHRDRRLPASPVATATAPEAGGPRRSRTPARRRAGAGGRDLGLRSPRSSSSGRA